jgi:MGT family glycosyltransferase
MLLSGFLKEIDHMAKYVFLNLPAHGHVNPTLPIVQELVRCGQEVSYYLTEEFREAVEGTGATFHSYESQMRDMVVIAKLAERAASMSPSQMPFEKIAGFFRQMVDQARRLPPGIIDRIRAEQPDVIVYGFMCAWAKTVVQELQVPAITTRASFAVNDHFDISQLILKKNATASWHARTYGNDKTYADSRWRFRYESVCGSHRNSRSDE